MQRFIFFLALAAVSQMIVLSSLLWPLIWAQRITLQTWPKYCICVRCERGPLICELETRPAQWECISASFSAPTGLWQRWNWTNPSTGCKKTPKNNNKKKKEPRMFIVVWKLSCIIPVLNARCPSAGWPSEEPTPFPGHHQTALWGGISHHNPPNETGLFVPIRWGLETTWKQNTEDRQSFTSGCIRGHLKPIHSGDGSPEEDETSVSVLIHWR